MTITTQQVGAKLRKQFVASSTRQTRIKGWSNSSAGYSVRKHDNDTVWVTVNQSSYSAFRIDVEATRNEIAEVLTTAGFNVTLIQNHSIMVKAGK